MEDPYKRFEDVQLLDSGHNYVYGVPNQASIQDNREKIKMYSYLVITVILQICIVLNIFLLSTSCTALDYYSCSLGTGI